MGSMKMVGKVFRVDQTGDSFILKISPQSGSFKPRGEIKVVLDGNSALDLVTKFRGYNAKGGGGSLLPVLSEKFTDQKIKIKLYPKK
ncbi:MAG: hypothetical protein V1866_02490 [archaeon]